MWSNDKSNSYAVRESSSKIKIFQNFKETKIIRPNFSAEGVFGGSLLGVRSTSFITFFDWEGRVIRKIDVIPKSVIFISIHDFSVMPIVTLLLIQVYWSDSGDVVTIACESSFFTLRFNKDITASTLDSGVEIGDEGIEVLPNISN